jgi:hypothetical protein
MTCWSNKSVIKSRVDREQNRGRGVIQRHKSFTCFKRHWSSDACERDWYSTSALYHCLLSIQQSPAFVYLKQWSIHWLTEKLKKAQCDINIMSWKALVFTGLPQLSSSIHCTYQIGRYSRLIFSAGIPLPGKTNLRLRYLAAPQLNRFTYHHLNQLVQRLRNRFYQSNWSRYQSLISFHQESASGLLQLQLVFYHFTQMLSSIILPVIVLYTSTVHLSRCRGALITDNSMWS